MLSIGSPTNTLRSSGTSSLFLHRLITAPSIVSVCASDLEPWICQALVRRLIARPGAIMDTQRTDVRDSERWKAIRGTRRDTDGENPIPIPSILKHQTDKTISVPEVLKC